MERFIRVGIILMLVAVPLFSSSFALAQPIDYGEYKNVTTYNAVVSGNKATVSGMNGEAGDTLEILCPMSLDGTALARIYIKLKGKVTNASITIEYYEDYSGGPDNGVSYFKIETSGIDESDIENVDVIFNAPSNLKNVQLVRKVNGVWTPLTTVSLGQEGDITWYRATSPGFSDFSITGVASGKAGTGGKLPFTSGMPLYVAGGVGLLLIASGIALRLKVR